MKMGNSRWNTVTFTPQLKYSTGWHQADGNFGYVTIFERRESILGFFKNRGNKHTNWNNYN